MRQRILVFGSSGMLGRALVHEGRRRGDEMLESPHSAGNIDSLGYTMATIPTAAPDVMINAAGAIPLKGRPITEMIRANALGPHVIGDVAIPHGIRFLHVSTDCVFRGDRMPGSGYRVDDVPDATDDYGRTKALGEQYRSGTHTVRCSFVGPEHGLWAWANSQPRGTTVHGWTNVFWTGSTVWAVARGLLDIAHEGTFDGGVIHLATDFIVSKAGVLRILLERRGVLVQDDPSPRVNRALEPSWPLQEFAEAYRSAMSELAK